MEIKNTREGEQLQKNLEYQKKELKVFVADILPLTIKHEREMTDRMLEVESLVNTYGGIVILKHIQKRGNPDYNSYIGSGKLDEIVMEMKELGADLLIFGNILKPIQIYNVNKKLESIGAKSWDRIDLILKIFEKHAKTTESRLQIELASIKYMGPRIFGMSEELGNQGMGGSKLSRGKGETNTSIMKTHLKNREKAIKTELEHFVKMRTEHRNARSRKGFYSVGIVGYTNAGKSSLMNVLTKKGVLVENKLFATLGTSVGKMYIESSEKQDEMYHKGTEILLIDTIGFIRDLPPKLIDAFASTLEDSIESDILLHVVDANDPKIIEKIQVVDEILEKIGATQKKIYVFNKTDLLSENELYELMEKMSVFQGIFVSSSDKKGMEELKGRILKELGEEGKGETNTF